MNGRLRIHFGVADLARLRVVPGPDPMWETVLSMHLLQTRRGSLFFQGWRQETYRRLDNSARLLFALNPAFGYFPDFLTPATGTTELEAGIDVMLSTPRRRLTAELGTVSVPAGLESWRRAVAGAEAAALREFGRQFRAYHRSAVLPVWDSIVARMAEERELLGRAFVYGGPAAVLASIGAAGGWQPPMLELPYPWDRDLRLDGRGLVLIPAYFGWKDPVTLLDPGLQPVLVYPVRHRRPVAVPAVCSGGDRSLAALIGPTRAAILRSLVVPRGTTDLATRAGTSISSASRHAAILRGAGLLTTVRDGGAVRHHVTALGAALLQTRTA